MRNLQLALLALGLIFAGTPAAQCQPALPLGPDDPTAELALLHTMADYTEVVMASAVTGAVIGNLVFGGVPPAAIGALVGGSLASLWFMHEVSANYQNRHHGDSRPSPNR